MREPTLLHHLLDAAADRTPDAPALTSRGRTLTYRELRAASLALAGWLVERGVRRGDRVVTAVPAVPELPALLYAASRVGAVFAVLHEQVRGRGLAHVLDDCEPVLVVVPGEAAGPAVERGIGTATPAELATAARRQEVPVLDGPAPEDLLCLVYTSGSTALPKAVMSPHRPVLFAVAAITAQLRYRPQDVIYTPLPLSFDYGMYQLFLAAAARAHVWLGSPAEAGPSLLANLRRSAATVLPAVPAVADALARLLRRDRGGLPALRLLTNTGAAMTAPVVAELRGLLPALRVQLMFGLTECKRAAIMPPDGDLERPGACGRALPGTRIVVCDPSGRPVPAGQTGEIVVRGPNVMAGYWRRPEDTALRFPRPGELHTGDYGWLDEDGYLYFLGRRDDIYKERGFRVSATEVEVAARMVPGVEAAAVLPPGDGRPAAVLAVVTGLPAGRVLELLRQEIEDFKVPARCVVVDQLPLGGNGKVDRKRLAADLAAGSIPRTGRGRPVS